MRYYETLYIVHPNYEEERLKAIQQDLDGWVSEKGGNIINSHVWGKRKLAYPVDKQKYGTYMLLNYGTDKPFVVELNNRLELNEAVLAYMSIRMDEAPVARDPNDGGASSVAPRKPQGAGERTKDERGE